LAVVWEWKREGPIRIRARSTEAPKVLLAEVRQFFEVVSERCRAGATERFYRRGQLHYDGLPWCGEVWLNDTLRLGPPSRQDETALLGPRVILVDALMDATGRMDANDVFAQTLQELSIFLSVVRGGYVCLPDQGRVWTWRFTDGVTDSEVRHLGYVEPENPQEIPVRGASRSMPLRHVNRPDFSERGIDVTTTELSLPSDAADLWAMYCALSRDKRRDFLQAAAKWQEALSQRLPERSTLSFALMVVACEALKPATRGFRKYNIYDVIEGLLGMETAARLKQHWFRPQEVRSVHLHRGEFRGSEYVLAAMMASYRDPTFDEAHRELARITQAAIIEWLRCGGNFIMPSGGKVGKDG